MSVGVFGKADAPDHPDDELLGDEAQVTAVFRIGDVVAAEKVIVAAERIFREGLFVEQRLSAAVSQLSARFVFDRLPV